MTYEEAIKELQILKGDTYDSYVCKALKIGIEALEKQIPMKPNKDVDTTWGIRKKVNVCPKCDYYLGNYAFINAKDILKKNKVIYCETCGQAIDFSEVE